MTPLLAAAAGTVAVNVPFGWIREGTRKLSVRWFIAVHAAVPLVILIRLSTGVALGWRTLPVLVFAYFLGQTLGARLRRRSTGPSG
jgi:hypothetical protein